MKQNHSSPLGPISAASIPWRARGALHLTVVVKATFALVPEGRMTIAEPDPIAPGEVPDPSGVGLRTAGDLAPYLGRADVWLTGHAAVPPRFVEPCVRVQLAVVQQGAVRIDKQLDLDRAGAAGDPPRVRIAGMGPIAADWPLRSRWLEGTSPPRLHGPALDLGGAIHSEYFQTSPLDQRLDAIRGDEWIVLGGMVAGRPRLRTQLPAAFGAARLHRGEGPAEPVALAADSLQIDVDRLRCSILWRGRVPIDDETALTSVRVVAGLEQPGRPIAWTAPEQPAIHCAARVSPASGSPLAATLDIPDRLAEALGRAPATPFMRACAPGVAREVEVVTPAGPGSGPGAPSKAPGPHGGAFDLPDDAAQMVAAVASGGLGAAFLLAMADARSRSRARGSPAPSSASACPE